MNLNIGDKVKFLNEVGGGTITKINSPISVTVETEDGFDIPMLTKELVKIEADSAVEKLFVEENLKQKEATKIVTKSAVAEERNTYYDPLLIGAFAKQTSDQTIYLAFIPREQTWLITGSIGLFLVNHSRHKVMFQLLGGGGKNYFGEIHPFTRFHLTEINREELEEFKEGIVQLMFIPNEDGIIYLPSSVDFKIKPSRFYQENSYLKPEYFYEKALIHRILDLSTLPKLSEKTIDQRKVEPIVVSTKSVPQKANDEILLYKTGEREAEVDMHIWRLVEDHTFLTKDEMLNLQLNYFEKCLSSAIEHHFTKVVFIHGVGTGRLRDEIRAKLDEYSFVHYKNASMAQYGVGATEVEISINK